MPTGVGTFGSRSAAVGGSAVLGASERVRDKVIRIAADALEAAPDDVEIAPGRISVRGVPDRSTTLAAIAGRAYDGKVPDGDEPGLEANRFFKPEGETFPFGMHLAVVEIDRDTGKVRLVRYLAVDDCGRVLNPMMVDGQRPPAWPLERDPWPLEASIPGVFVAGDVRADSVKRVASAVGEGAMAVTLAHRYLGTP